MGSRARPKMSDVDEQRAFFVSRKAKAKAAADVRKGKSWQKILSGKANRKKQTRKKQCSSRTCMKVQNTGGAYPEFSLLRATHLRK